jgi:hypothetical protein
MERHFVLVRSALIVLLLAVSTALSTFAEAPGGLAPGMLIQAPVDILLKNFRILSETAAAAGQTDVEFTADILNTETGHYRDVTMSVATTNLPPNSTVLNSMAAYPVLGELATLVSGVGQTLTVRTLNTNLESLRAVILNGSLFQVSAFEEQVYSGPTKFIDQETDDQFENTIVNGNGQTVLLLSIPTTLSSNLVAGNIIIADSSAGGYRPRTTPRTGFSSVLVSDIPFQVDSVSTVNGKVNIAGHRRALNEILKSGSFYADDHAVFRDVYDPPVENTFTDAEEAARAIQRAALGPLDPRDPIAADLFMMNAIPWHFNDVKISKYLHLSGQVLLRSSGLRFQVTFRDFAIKRASVGIDAGITASMVVETTGTNNNKNLPFLQKQKQLVVIPLAPPPGIPLTIGGVPCNINLGMTLSVGAEADAPAGLSIPLETSATIGTEIGWADGETFSTPIQEFVAPHVSDPTVFQAITASVKAWAEVRLDASITIGSLISTGPSLAIRAQSEFNLDPLQNPWWSVDAGADLVGAFRMNLLGFNIAEVSATNHVATFFHRDAGGPLIAAPAAADSLKAAAAAAPMANLAPASGKNTRWGLAFAPQGSSGEYYAKGFVQPLSGGGYFIGGSAALPAFLSVVSSNGVMQWIQTFPTGARPVDGAQLSDGSVMVAGNRGLDWWLAKYDTAGNRSWVVSYQTSADFRKMAVGTAANGDPEFYLAGFVTPASVAESDPIVLKLDKAGQIIWSKKYVLPGDDEVYSIRALRDGNFVLCGITDTKVGTDLFIGAHANGLVMKISPAGDLLWANSIAGRYGMLFRDAAEAPDGSIFAAGSHGDLVTDFYPSIMVAKFSPDGILIHHVLIGEDPDTTDELANGGDTPYDYASQIIWTENGLVMVGNTGLGYEVSGWVAGLTDELGVRWFSSFDAPGEALLLNVAATDAGIAALGWADNVWPIKFDNRSPGCLLSLPWEGLMRFHPESGIQSRYLQPRVFQSDANADFHGRYTDNFQNLQTILYAPALFTVESFPTAAADTIVAGVLSAFDTARLERIEPATVRTYAQFATYYQMTGATSKAKADFDGDGIPNGAEFFFGSDPLLPGSSVTNGAFSGPLASKTGEIAIETFFILRSAAARNETFEIEQSTGLDNWATAVGATTEVISSGDSGDLLRITFPAPNADHAFFRVRIPLAP